MLLSDWPPYWERLEKLLERKRKMDYKFAKLVGFEYWDSVGNRLIVEDEIYSPWDDDVQAFLVSQGYDGPGDWE